MLESALEQVGALRSWVGWLVGWLVGVGLHVVFKWRSIEVREKLLCVDANVCTC